MNFSPTLAQQLPVIYALLRIANLTVHPSVARIVLHGSRGLAGGARQDSDIDLSLIVDLPAELGTQVAVSYPLDQSKTLLLAVKFFLLTR